jgi:hypothetical protein
VGETNGEPRNESEPISSLVNLKGEKGEPVAETRSQYPPKGTEMCRMDFLQGKRIGMLRKVSSGTWKSLLCEKP